MNYKYLDEFHKDEFETLEKAEYYRDRELTAKAYDNAVILPFFRENNSPEAKGGVLDEKGDFIDASRQHIVGTDIVAGYKPETVAESDKKVVWFGYFHNHWGHFLTEMVSRCWYFIDHNPEEEDFYVAYALKSDSCNLEMSGSFREFLNLLGVSDDRIVLVTEATRFSQVIIPEISSEAGEWYTDQYTAIFDRLISVVDKKTTRAEREKYRKVYLTRLKGRGLARTQIGERSMMKVFKAAGYRIVAPENLTLKEQIIAYSSCEKLTIVEGTLMHNILFCKPETKVTILNRGCGANYYQHLLNKAKGVNVTYVDCHLSFFPVFAGGPFLFYFDDNFCRYCEDESLKYLPYKEGAFRLHLKLIWYFLMYLESMPASTIDMWSMEEKYNEGMMTRYRFYRDKLKDYDKKTTTKIRSGLIRVTKAIFKL